MNAMAATQDGSACRREIESLACGVRETLPHDPVPLRVVQVGLAHSVHYYVTYGITAYVMHGHLQAATHHRHKS